MKNDKSATCIALVVGSRWKIKALGFDVTQGCIATFSPIFYILGNGIISGNAMTSPQNPQL